MPIYLIPEDDLSALRKTIERLARTATRLGCTGITFRDTGETKMAEIQTESLPFYRKLVEVEVTGEAPRIAGWSFLAAVEPAEETGLNILHVLGDISAGTLDPYRSCALRCDHCHANRRRVKAYIVKREEDGVVAMVGSDCLAHYTGHESPGDIARAAELLAYIFEAVQGSAEGWDEFEDGGKRAIRYIGTADYLAAVAAEIRTHGWVSRTQARDTLVVASADRAAEGLMGTPEHREEWHKSVGGVQPGDIEQAVASLEWARALAPRSDYEWNIHILAQSETVHLKHLGIAASIVAGYLRAQGEEIRRKAMAAQSRHIGTVGKRETFRLMFQSSKTIEGGYGVTHILTFTEGAGNLVIWFSSNSPKDLGLREGEAYDVTASVKAHGEYKSVPQTTITRGKVAPARAEAA